MQHATVFDVFDLDGCIDPAFHGDFFDRAIGESDLRSHLLQWLDRIQTFDGHRFFAGQTQCFAAVAAGELEWNNAHANKVGAVDTLKAFCDHGFDAQAGLCPLAAQSREEPAPYCSPAKITSGVPAS